MRQMTLDEKIRMMSGHASIQEAQGAIRGRTKTHYNELPYQAGGNETYHVPPVSFVDGSRGVVCGRGVFTCFPVGIMRGATFNTELERKIGIAVGEEVLEAGGNLFGGVCVNLIYHPGWGRAQETYGEDSCLLGKMGSAMIEGVQASGVIACVKHFAFHSMENVRHRVNILCDKRTEREVFLPHFRKCIEAGAGAVMCAYNAYQGEKCGQNPYLIKEILKNEWGFDGFVLSDFTWGITDTCQAVKAGLDLEMPATYYYGERLKKLVIHGEISEKMIDASAVRIVRTVLAHQEKRKKQAMTEDDFIKHRKLALKCAEEGITLLKNQQEILPMKTKGKKVVVLGKLANREATGDRGSSQVYPPYVVTPLQGIVQNMEKAEIVYYEGENLSHVERIAKDAQYVILVVGNSYVEEGEAVEAGEKRYMGGDRKAGLGLKEDEVKLIQTVGAFREDAIIVLIGGGMIPMEEWCEQAGAILQMYYAGMEGGNALGRILTGKTNPSGKLPFSIVKEEADLPEIDWEAWEQRYDYYQGYALLNKMGKEPRYPFGFGLSYTCFSLSEYEAWCDKKKIYVSVVLENIGAKAGAEVVQLYIEYRDAEAERPRKVLKDFRKKYLRAGQKEKIILTCEKKEIAYFDEQLGDFVDGTGNFAVWVGTSSAETDLYRVPYYDRIGNTV